MKTGLLLFLAICVSVTVNAQDVVNLALGKKATGSSQWSSKYSADKAIDGDLNTRWSASSDLVEGQWLQIDFGSTVQFDRLVLTEYATRVNAFEVLVSDDATNWKVAYAGTLIHSGEEVLLDHAVTNRYLRLNFLSCTDEPNICEIGVYYAKSEIPLPEIGKSMIFENRKGPLTKLELDYYKAYLKQGLALATDNIGNQLVYGRIGLATEGMAFMYAATGDREILDLLIQHCDYMLYCRNDQPGGDKRTIWTGNIEKCWPNKAIGEPDQPYSASENGDIVGHIYFCAYLILLSPQLYALEAPASSKLTGWGVTYLDRAKKFIAMCDETMEFMERLLSSDGRMYYPNTSEWRAMGDFYMGRNGRGFPVNQQMMLLNGFQKAMECYEVLGINAAKKEKYKQVIQNSIDWQHETLETKKVTVDGTIKEICLWYYYVEGQTVEDYGHAAFTMQTYYKLIDSRLFSNLDAIKLSRFSNALKYVMYDAATRTVSHKVNGTTPSGEKRASDAKAGWILLSVIDPELYDYLLTMPGNTATDPGLMAHFLYVKSKLFGTTGFTASPIDLSNYGQGATGIENVRGDANALFITWPMKDLLHIETGLPLKSVKIVSVDGQVVMHQSVEPDINVSHLSAGIYLILLETTDGNVIIRKIIKE